MCWPLGWHQSSGLVTQRLTTLPAASSGPFQPSACDLTMALPSVCMSQGHPWGVAFLQGRLSYP